MLIVHTALLLSDWGHAANCIDANHCYYLIFVTTTFISRTVGVFMLIKLGDKEQRPTIKLLINFMHSFLYLAALIISFLASEQIAAHKCQFIAIISAFMILHGFFSANDGLGARLYLTENTQASKRYSTVGLIDFAARFGNFIALILIVASIKLHLHYRALLVIMLIISVLIGIMRLKLRNARLFTDAKRRLKHTIRSVGHKYSQVLQNNMIWKHEPSLARSFALLCTELSVAGTFFFVYIYMSTVLKNTFQASVTEIILNNAHVAAIEIFSAGIVIVLSRMISPMKIFKIKLFTFVLSLLFLNKFLSSAQTINDIFRIQCFYSLLLLSPISAYPALYKHFSVFKRFRYTTIIFALSKAITFSFGLLCIFVMQRYIGYHSVTLFMIVIASLCTHGFLYFEKLNKHQSGYPDTERWGMQRNSSDI